MKLFQTFKAAISPRLTLAGHRAEFHRHADQVVDGLEASIETVEAGGGLIVIRLHFRTDVVLRVFHLLTPDAEPVDQHRGTPAGATGAVSDTTAGKFEAAERERLC